MFLRLNVAMLGLVLALETAAPSAQVPTLQTAMREKLANTQALLGAVITADYAAMERYSAALSRISETEIVSWQAVAQPAYVDQAMRFLVSVKGLREAAARKDVEAAREEYTNLISACVHCHAYVRNSRTIAFEPDGMLRPRGKSGL